MIFHCPKCRSKYKIAGHIITEKGINAKCHKCGNIFFVKKKEEIELTNIVSGIKENISRWEETAKPIETGEAVIKDEEGVNDFISEIEFDFSKGKNLPGEERLKELLTDESLISNDKTAKEEAIEKSPDLSEDVISSVMIESDEGKQSVESPPLLNLEVKSDGFPSQDDMDKFLSDVIQSAPEGEVSNITETSEKGTEPHVEESVITAPAPDEGSNNMDIDLDKLMDDTAAELDSKIADNVKKDDVEQLLDIKSDDKNISKAEENIKLEDIPKGELGKEVEDILLKKIDRSVVETGVSEERQPEIKDELHEDIMPDLEDELKPKGGKFGRDIKEKWQNFIFLLSSYSLLLVKKTVIWKLAILSVAGIIIIGGVVGLIVIGGKKIISKPKEKKEVAVEAVKHHLKEPSVDEKKVKDVSKAIVEEKSAEQVTPQPPPSAVENSVRLDAILPVPFSPEENKVMSINVRLELENKEGVDRIKGNLPYYEEIIEDSVDQFFKDKFYEDTHFVKEKLKEVILRKINENIKNGRVKKVDLEEIKVK
ncbi:MAG: zinc-ribbon domain-containing protein [Nitrospinae bacterium]|nr:zinc-ribbon domain-containing protein [Nitrospinota bacterium]